MASESGRCPACRHALAKATATGQALDDLHGRLEAGDYNIKDLPTDALLGYKIMADLASEVPDLAGLAPILEALGESFRLHLDAFNTEIMSLEGLRL